jgi:hypothetical protein
VVTNSNNENVSLDSRAVAALFHRNEELIRLNSDLQKSLRKSEQANAHSSSQLELIRSELDQFKKVHEVEIKKRDDALQILQTKSKENEALLKKKEKSVDSLTCTWKENRKEMKRLRGEIEDLKALQKEEKDNRDEIVRDTIAEENVKWARREKEWASEKELLEKEYEKERKKAEEDRKNSEEDKKSVVDAYNGRIKDFLSCLEEKEALISELKRDLKFNPLLRRKRARGECVSTSQNQIEVLEIGDSESVYGSGGEDEEMDPSRVTIKTESGDVNAPESESI